ncbi:polyribonucleotide nucleotidyltransferase [Candidatus Dojkabacteria bacterium]|nr:polyribonucleotide nucleotidyltransferase [Candidatus Dojkabacteria bacterium]
MENKIVKSCNYGDRKISFEIGEFAPRAKAAIVASMGETVVLTTVTVSSESTDKDYFPLGVEFIEKFYAGGIISGSRFIKRERFPSEEAILKARMIDRSLRPLFPEDFRREVQVVVTVLSYDDENDPAILGINAASLAMCISGVPFNGPIAGIRVGLKDGKFLLNPGNGDLEKSDLDFVVSGKGEDIMMIDAGANEVTEEKIAEVFDFAISNFPDLIKFQKEVIKEIKIEKVPYEKKEVNEDLVKKLTSKYDKDFENTIYELKGNIPGERRSEAIAKIVEEFTQEKEGEYSKAEVAGLVEKIIKGKVREGVLDKNKRPSGREFDEIREIDCRVGILPRTHGSAFFARGITQALSIVTLASTRLEQTLESFEGEETKRFMHHYNGQSFSLGEAGRYNYYPGRREIGHGALAEKALRPMMPSEEQFPYTIRVVSEILSQQGSSSMASTCGATLALMDAGVPIKSPVAGIAIGLVTSDDMKKYALLTDMQDLEDFYGDMDFKVTGTKEGVTAIQMDNKLNGIKVGILKEALEKAKIGRLFVLEKMLAVLPEPRKELSKYAPKITTVKIDPEKIADVIGPQGKVIKDIIEKTGVEIDIKDDGLVHVAAVDMEAKEKALEMINSIVEEAEVGKVYEGEVATLAPYGVFVDVTPAISGLVHISEMADKFVSDPSQIVKKGERVKVKVIGIDDEGKISFSMKRVKEQDSKEGREDKRPDKEGSAKR